MLVASEATLFGTFIGTYYYLRFTSVHWPPPGTPEPRVVVPLIMAGDPRHDEPADAARGAGRAARPALDDAASARLGARRPVRLPRLGDPRLRAPAAPLDARRTTRTARSTTCCSAPTTRMSRSGSSSAVWLLWKLARGLTMYRLDATAGRRLLLARRQRPDPDRDRRPPERERYERARRTRDTSSRRVGRFTLRQLGVVQWIGVVVAPLGVDAPARRRLRSRRGPLRASPGRAGASRYDDVAARDPGLRPSCSSSSRRLRPCRLPRDARDELRRRPAGRRALGRRRAVRRGSTSSRSPRWSRTSSSSRSSS